jgi:hypothetical protein
MANRHFRDGFQGYFKGLPGRIQNVPLSNVSQNAAAVGLQGYR